MSRGCQNEVIESAVAAPIRPDPMQMMMNARELPTLEFVDHTFVFNWTAGSEPSKAVTLQSNIGRFDRLSALASELAKRSF